MTSVIRIAGVFICGLLVSSVSPGQTQVFTLGPYGYDGAGNISAIGADSFTYDEFGRITWGTAGTGRNERYTYDRWGNLVTITTDDAASPRVTIGVDSTTNRATESTGGANAFASYDASTGQVTSYTGGSFTYDAAGMVKQSTIDGVTRVHLYSPSDERIASFVISQNVETISEWSFRDTAGRVLRRASRAAGNDNNWTWHQDYIYRDGQLLAAEVPTSAGRLHFHLDHLGTLRLITDRGGREVSRHTYYPFGMEATPRSTAERMKFTGHERDFAAGAGTDLDYMHARLFRPAWGRFLSADPFLDVKRSIREPQSWNRYSYVMNNPINRIDPDGRVDQNWDGGAAQQLFPDDRAAQLEWEEGVGKKTAIASALTVAAISGPSGWRAASMFAMRNPAVALLGLRAIAALGGDGGNKISIPGGQTAAQGKVEFLLGQVANNAKSLERGATFAGKLGFTGSTLGAALKSHLLDNAGKATIDLSRGSPRVTVTATMTGANGVKQTVTTVWQYTEKQFRLVTAW